MIVRVFRDNIERWWYIALRPSGNQSAVRVAQGASLKAAVRSFREQRRAIALAQEACR